MKNELLNDYRDALQEENKSIVADFLDHLKKLNIDIFKSNIVTVELEGRPFYNGVLKITVDGKTIYKQDNFVLFPEKPAQGLFLYLTKRKKANELSIIADALDISIEYERLNNKLEYTYITGILWWKKEHVETRDCGIKRYTIDLSNIK